MEMQKIKISIIFKINFIYLFIYGFIYLRVFIAVLGLFSGCSQQRLLFVAVHGFSLWWLLFLKSIGSRHVTFSSCGAWAQLLRGMQDLPGLGIEPVSPALAGGFLTTAPPVKPKNQHNFEVQKYQSAHSTRHQILKIKRV